MTIETTVQIWREGDQYVAHAMPIDVMSSGPTREAARAAVDAAVRLFCTTAAADGILGQILAECGHSQQGDQQCP